MEREGGGRELKTEQRGERERKIDREGRRERCKYQLDM